MFRRRGGNRIGSLERNGEVKWERGRRRFCLYTRISPAENVSRCFACGGGHLSFGGAEGCPAPFVLSIHPFHPSYLSSRLVSSSSVIIRLSRLRIV